MILKPERIFIIAEAGVNHNGSLELAKKLIDVAYEAGADAVKFQTFKADLITTSKAAKAEYQIQNTGGDESQQEMLKKLELSREDHITLIDYSKSLGVKFLSTPFDIGSLNELVEMGVDILKIGSGDITNAPLLLKAGRSGLPVIISSGLSNLDDIENALAVLAFGYKYSDKLPNNHQECLDLLSELDVKARLKEMVTILHCTTDYPADFTDINLRAMSTIAKEFDMRVGYSDHSIGTLVPVVAASLGASVIEKHVTLDKSMSGPDHKASLDPSELKFMVQSIRDTEVILGDAKKAPTQAELKNKNIVRRGVYAAKDIELGKVISLDNIITLRPENSISPLDIWDYLGRKAKKAYKKYDVL
jgi:N-acetylneuraminate synthase